MASPLRKLLEKESGWEEFQWIIPHPFLPPRFRKLSHNRNMLLLLDQEMTLHIRWEGARRHEHHPLTPRATCRLIAEVLDRMSQYRKDLQVFSRFISKNAELPFDNPRDLNNLQTQARELPPAPKEEEEEIVEVHTTISIPQSEMGGESPLPMMEDFYE